MKKKLFVVLSLITMVLLSANVYAQEGSASRAGFQIGGYLPLGDWSKNVSAGIGGSALYNYKITSGISLTGAIGYYNFPAKHKLSETATVNDTGDYEYTVVPFLAGLRVGFGPSDQAFQPYVGFELGFFITSSDYKMKVEGGSVVTVDNDSPSPFGFAPAIGFRLKLGLDVDLDVNAKFNIAKEVNHLGLNLGVMFRI
jgi:hypothetical protein